MSFVNKVSSAIGKLVLTGLLMFAFLVGLGFVVYRSLQGTEVAVPEIVGKNFAESEKELEALGLRIKKRADRYSEEAPNTVLEQIPRPGDTVKTGQMILVVTSKSSADGDEKPSTLRKGNSAVDEDDSKKIEELISDTPKKKSNSNANVNKKKSSTTRDVIKDNSNTGTNTGKSSSNSSPEGSKEPKEPANPTKTPAASGPATTPKPAPRTPAPATDSRPRRNPDQ